MKKLFLAIRHGDFEEVKKTLNNYPEALNEAAAPPPKKDKDLSPLQVALKVGELEIAKYLIEQGADVNYINPIDENDKYIWSMPVLQDAIGAVFFAYEKIFDTEDDKDMEKGIAEAEAATNIVREMLKRGADPNIIAWKTCEKFHVCTLRPDGCAISRCIWSAHFHDEKLRDIAFKKITELLDLLLEYGADFEAWAKQPVGHYSDDNDTNQKNLIDYFVPVPDTYFDVIIRNGRKTVINAEDPAYVPRKGDKRETWKIDGSKDNRADIRAFMQDFCKKRGLLGK